MEKLVAAHRLMPFNTWVRVTNLANNKTVDVRIIDRGPFVDGRIIDLSKAAARSIDLLGPGIGQVRLEVIAAPQDILSNDFYAVQVGAFAIYANADRLRQGYAERFGTAQLVIKEGTTPLWRVLVGKVNSVDAAQALADQIRAEGREVFVVRLDSTLPPPPTGMTTQVPFPAVAH
jgi:rare lipoprotein A